MARRNWRAVTTVGGIVLVPEVVANALTVEEADEKAHHMTVVSRGVFAWIEVSVSLKVLREKKLYRDTHDTWEEFCQDNWGYTRQYANKLIAANDVRGDLETRVSIPPTNEAQIRPLLKLGAVDDRVAAWQLAVEQAGGGVVTGKRVANVVATFQTPPDNPKLDHAITAATHLAKAYKLVGPDQWVEFLQTNAGLPARTESITVMESPTLVPNEEEVTQEGGSEAVQKEDKPTFVAVDTSRFLNGLTYLLSVTEQHLPAAVMKQHPGNNAAIAQEKKRIAQLIEWLRDYTAGGTAELPTSRRQQAAYTELRTTNTSGFMGVHRHRKGGKWRARGSHNGTQIQIGMYDTPEEAARAYDAKVIEWYGPDAVTNVSKGLLPPLDEEGN